MTRGQKALTVLFLCMLPLVTPKIRGADEIQYFSHLRSLVFDHDLDFENEYRHFYERDPQALAGFKGTYLDRREAATGRNINFTPIGCALLWSPFYLLAHGLVLGARALGASVAADGYSLPYTAAACYASVLYGFLGLLLTHDALRRWGGIDDGPAAATVAALWWGTPLLYYMTLAPCFSHSTSVLTVGLLLWLSLRAWARKTWTPREGAVIGLAGGIAALVYEKEALYLVAPSLLLAGWLRETRRWGQALWAGIAMALVSILVFVPQTFAYESLNGSHGPSPLVRRKMILTSPHVLQVLFDPSHGFFIWAPLATVAAFGLVVLCWRRRDAPPLALLAGFALQVWICGSVDSWHLAGAFGLRRLVSATPVLAFGLAAIVAPLWSRWGRAATLALLAVFVWWNLSLMVQFGLRLVNSRGDRQGLEWPRVARNQFVTVPQRLGRVAWLFLTDRERLVQETR